MHFLDEIEQGTTLAIVEGVSRNGSAKTGGLKLEHFSGLKHVEFHGRSFLNQELPPELLNLLPIFLPPTLLELEFNEINLRGDAASLLASALESLSSLHTLKFVKCRPGIATIVPSVKNLVNLEHLALPGNGLGADGIKSLSPYLENLTSLKSLDLSANMMSSQGAEALAPFLGKLIHLRVLDLKYNSIKPEGGKHLIPVLGNLSQLEDLNLGWNFLQGESTLLLCATLEKLTSLRTVQLFSNGFASAHAPLASALEKLGLLETLNLSSADVGQSGAKFLAETLSHLTKLKQLNLRDNLIGAVGGQAIGPQLKHLVNLQSLNLAVNDLGLEGLCAVLSGLETLATVEELNLGWNAFGLEGASRLASVLPKLSPCLKRLGLEYNEFGWDGVHRIVSVLPQCPLLETLDLTGNFIHSQGLIAIAKLLKEEQSFPSLRKVSLKQHSLEPDDIEPFVEALEELAVHTKLLSFELSGNGLIREDFKPFAFRLIGCSHFTVFTELFEMKYFERYQNWFKLVIAVCSARKFGRLRILPAELVKKILQRLHRVPLDF